MKLRFATIALSVALCGCNYGDQIKQLQDQNAALKAQIDKSQTAANYDLQARCAKDARAWFNENFPSDKSTLLLTFTNHYNKSMNHCFISVEYHFSTGAGMSWINDQSVWDIYENAQYANFTEFNFNPDLNHKPSSSVTGCEVQGQKCTSQDQFNDLVRSYMAN